MWPYDAYVLPKKSKKEEKPLPYDIDTQMSWGEGLQKDGRKGDNSTFKLTVDFKRPNWRHRLQDWENEKNEEISESEIKSQMRPDRCVPCEKVKKAASPVGCWSGADVKVLRTEKTNLNQMPGLSGKEKRRKPGRSEAGQKDTKVRKKLELHLKNNFVAMFAFLSAS